MIRMLTHTVEGRILLIVIISKGNWNYLQKRMPIHFSKEDMGLVELKIDEMVIAYYDTEEEAKKDFIKHGLITDTTTVHDTDKQTKPQ